MKLAALIVDNRDIDFQPIYRRHTNFLPKNTPVIHYKTTDTTTIAGYNKLLTNLHFWSEFTNYDRVLIFQHDSGLLRHGIEQFYSYDYIGAPWKFQQHGGNGGLSLRNPTVMKELLYLYPYHNNTINEDVYISNIMFQKNIGNLAHREACNLFSVETIFQLNTLGYHAIDKYHDPLRVKMIIEQYM
jgi:hypothetical protein